VSSTPEMDMGKTRFPLRLENATPRTTRVGTVILGRMDFLSVLLRLIGMELYKIRRRPMSKVLALLAALLALLVPLAVGGELLASQSSLAGEPDLLAAISEPLRLPSSLGIASTQGELNPAIILIIILVGAQAGGELSIGTVRLMFTRGPWRGQFLLAKYGAALVCTVLGVLGMTLVGVLAGQIFNLLCGQPQSLAFLTPAWLGHALLYLLATMLNWFMYAVVAIFFAVLGRSTTAGIAGALTWFFGEPIVSSILTIAGNFSVGKASDFLHALPDYLMGNNARALQLSQASVLFGGNTQPAPDLQRLIVLAVYLAVFLGLTWWLNESRDVTN
jgi:ABC-type transport system involved in multi-copper enzyme maturation permease subunit